MNDSQHLTDRTLFPVSSLPENESVKRAAKLNTQTRILTTYRSHQRKTMELIAGAARNLRPASQRTISVLGAGNCMDLDLKQLTEMFDKVALLDLDREAVESGIRGIDWPLASPVRIVAPIDLAMPLAETTLSHISDSETVIRLCEELMAPLQSLPVEPADVVVSTCVLSQILSSLNHLVSESHAQFLPLLQAVRRGHIVRMLQLLKPGGRGVLITDLVSSETTPALLSAKESELPSLLADALTRGNFFSGLHPGVMLQDFGTCAEIALSIANPSLAPPWCWQMGPRTYAVYAVSFHRR